MTTPNALHSRRSKSRSRSRLSPSRLDIELGPDPGPIEFAGDGWYRKCTNERALQQAERRHVKELKRRYVAASDWADYSVRDLRLPLTDRQRALIAAVAVLAAVLGLVATLTASASLLGLSAVLTTLSVPVLVRDAVRRVLIWAADDGPVFPSRGGAHRV